ncbi:MAG: tetratricopeptide repeat protein [Pseudomonadota bacterium]
MRRLLLIFMLPMLLHGCAYLASVSGDVDHQIEQWVQQQEYGKALSALSYIKPQHPDYARLMKKRDAVVRQAEQYARDTANQSAELARQGQWAQALELSTAALKRFPESSVLQHNHQRLLQQQAARLDEIDLELLQARAEGLLHLLPVYTSRATVDPYSWRARYDLRQLQEEAAEVSGELTRRGRLALERKDMVSARRSLNLALRLSPGPETRQANKELLRRLAPAVPATSGKASVEDETQELLQQYRQAYDSKNWIEAQRLLALLELQPTPPQELPQLRSELNAEVAEVVNRHTEQGITLYSRGKYEQALAAWRKAQQLDPANERVATHIERAERVLEKLRALQEKRSGE